VREGSLAVLASAIRRACRLTGSGVAEAIFILVAFGFPLL
jgi:hypothetical protein